jgi:RNA polymerase sigma-70 factor, ECF subfamily
MAYERSINLEGGARVKSSANGRVDGLASSAGKSVSKEEAKARIELLVKKAQKGDTDAFSVVYDSFVDQIYRYVYFRVPKGEVEDIVEMVFLKAWEKIRQYQPGRKSFSAWIYRIAHNLVIDTYRFKKDKGVVELTPNVPEYRREHNPIKMTENALHADKLKDALSKLKKNYKQIIVLKFMNDLPNSEIAQIINKSEGSVRILQFRALKALKKELEDLGVTDH